MDKRQLMIAGGVGGAGLLAVLYFKHRAAANAAAANATTNTSGNIDLGSLSSLAPASTGVSTGGEYAYSSASDTGTDTNTSVIDPSASVANFAQLLQGILTTGIDAQQKANANMQQTNAAAVQAIQQVAPVPLPVAAPTPVPTPAPYSGPMDLSTVTGGYLTANMTRYAADPLYAADWDRVAAANQARFGTGWNRVAAGANQTDLNRELSDGIPGGK